MAENIGKKIEQRTGYNELIHVLSERLTGSELNSLLLEVFSRRMAKLTPPAILKQYETNRFVHPAETNYIHLLEKSVQVLKVFSKHGFLPRHLSPLSQAGSCSVMATVDQDKIVTALRNTEVLSDATNALALYISHLKKNKDTVLSRPEEHIKFCSVQRHVRSQPTSAKGFSPHFTIGCLVSSGIDTGNYSFEKKSIGDHFIALQEVLGSVFNVEKIYFKIQKRNGYKMGDQLVTAILDYLRSSFRTMEVRLDEQNSENNYYKGIQFKTVIAINGNETEIADGGFVEWTQQLLNNKKERFCISGFGLELLNKLEEGLM